ncbi:MAG: hypothetical protein ACYC2I_03110, partial [Elusimicrobiales bacterium]
MVFRTADKGREKRGSGPRVLSFGRSLLSLAFLLYPLSFVSAETRIKTVEYNFGGNYGADVNSGTQFNFPARTVKLPENGKTIRSAWLEFEGLAVSGVDVNPIRLYFDAGASATTVRLQSVQYTDSTAESIRLFARADVTAAVQAELAQLAAGRQFTAGVAITGPASNSHAMKLYVTYEYDDQSPTQVKTVRFPLYSDYASGIAAFTGQQAAGTALMQYNAQIADSGVSLQQQWFELRGYHQNGTSDGTLGCQIGAGAAEPAMNLDDSLGDSYSFLYLSSSDQPDGFLANTLQTLNVAVGVAPVNLLSGEVVLTYEFSRDSASKTRTARYFLGQGTLANSTTDFAMPLYLREEGITLRRVYALVAGSFDSATGDQLPLASSIGGTDVPLRNYAIQTTASQVSGFQFFHDLTPALAGWTNGEVVRATVTAVSNAGGATGAPGMELIITYDYTNDAAHTSSYEVLAGSDVSSALDGTYSSYVNLYYPEAYGAKVMRSAWLYADIIQNDNIGDFNTTIDFNGDSAQTTYVRSITETTYVNRFYGNTGQAAAFPAQVAVNYSVSTGRGTLGGRASVNYGFTPVPKLPQSLGQKANGAALATGAWTNSPAVAFEGTASSSMTADNLALVLELKPAASAFDGAGLATGTLTGYSASPLSLSISSAGLVSGTQYKWRLRVLGDGGDSGWIAFASPSFGVDLSSPPAPAMAAIAPAHNANLSITAFPLSWEAVADTGGSGLKNYELQVATSADYTTLSFSSAPLAAYAQISGLTQKYYYWRLRALDNAGNTGLWTSDRNFRVDLSTPTATSNMGTGDQSWRKANDGLYDVDFADLGDSLIKQVEVRVTSGAAQTGTVFADWTPALTGVDAASYSADWALPSGVWDLLQSWTTNFISVRVVDYSSQTYTLNDAFRVFKDTVAPAFTNGEAGGDPAWRKTGRNYNVDFADPYSKLAGAKYEAWTGAARTGTQKKTLTAIPSVAGASFGTDWAVDFAALEGDNTNYISVEFYDIAGNTTTITDAFKVLKDTTAPSNVNGEAGGDAVWRKAGRNYNVDFNDAGSGLNGAKYAARTGPGYTGTLKVASTTIAGVAGASFNADWAVDFASLEDGAANYVSIEMYDVAGNTATITDAFYIKKDTTPPSNVNGEAGGDSVWRKTGRNYNVDFADAGSGLNSAKYAARTGPNYTGTLKVASTTIAGVSGASYSADWGVDFNALEDSAPNYVSIELYDLAGNTTTITDAFYVRKDTTPPSFVNGEAGGDPAWRKTGRNYNFDLSDAGSGLNGAKYAARTSAGGNPPVKIGSTTIPGVSGASFNTDWAVDFVSLEGDNTNYISVEAYDIAGNTVTVTDAFKVLKDTTPPSYVNGEAGGDAVWRKTGRNYDVDFADASSRLSGAKYEAWTGAARTGTQKKTLTSIPAVSGPSYNADWAADFDALADEASNYISVEVYDVSGNTSTITDAFIVRKDTTAPRLADGQAGDAVWRNSPGTVYNVGFTDPVLLQHAQYSIWSEPGRTGTLRKDWAYINGSPIDSPSYATDWPVDFSALAETQTTNYVSVRAWDVAGSTSTFNDVFYVQKDVSLPFITDSQSGDDSWRSSSGTLYGVAFGDTGGSLLNNIEYKITTGAGQGGTLVLDWTALASGIGAASYPGPWALPQAAWNGLPAGLSYVSVRTSDYAGNSQSQSDVFYVKKDTQAPSITDNQAGDSAWRKDGSAVYNVDFADAGGSLLQKVQVKITTGPSQTGTLITDWADNITAIDASSYSADWPLAASLFDLLAAGTNYVSVRVFDNAGSTSTLTDAFYVKKDTSTPSVTDGQSGDDNWRRFGGTAYNVDFADPLSGLAGAKYEAWTGPARTGTQKIALTAITGVTGAQFVTDWTADFALLEQGTNYISVEAYDALASTASAADVFYVKKDNTAPVITDNQSGDNTWRNAAGTVYNVDFQDLTSKLATAQYRITSAAGQGGTVIKDWTDLFTGQEISSYGTDWQVDFAALTSGVTGYVSARAWDAAGNAAQVNDVFLVLKDTVAPTAVSNAASYGAYITDPGPVFDVDFNDAGGSLLSKFQYFISSVTAMGGTPVKDWTDAALGIGATFYANNFQADFYALLREPATNYFSVRAYDNAGNVYTLADAFKVFRSSSVNPDILDNQAGDDAWRNSNAGTYNVDFSTNSGHALDYFQAKVHDALNQGGTLLADWTLVQGSIGAGFYGTNWALPAGLFTAMKEGVNYVSVRVYDSSPTPNSSTLNDVFYVRKDTTAPAVPALSSPADGVFYNHGGPSFDWADAAGTASGIAAYEIKIATAADFTTVTASSSPSISQASFTGLAGNPYYWKVRSQDNAGNYSAYSSTRNFIVDLTTPTVSDLQADATYYLTANTALYNVNFDDLGGSLLDKVQVRITSGPAQTGTVVADWTDAATGINSISYSTDWALPASAWNALPSGPTGYISVKVFDRAGNNFVQGDVFTVWKDTAAPYTADNQSGDNVWRASDPGAVYDVDFYDLESLLTTAQYRLYSGAGQTGTLLKDWTTIAFLPAGTSHYAANWGVDFAAAVDGASYASVRLYDRAGLTSQISDVFYVRKDTTVPSITDSHAGDAAWRGAPGTAYNVDFADLASGLTTVQYRITSAEGGGGTVLRDWTDIATDLGGLPSYDTDWTVDFSALPEAATSYVSVRGYDAALHTSSATDVFYIKKDVSLPSVTDNQPGDDSWRNAGTAVYNVDFADAGGSLLSKFQVKATTGPNQSGTTLFDWTDKVAGINAAAYTADWGLGAGDWNSLQSGLNYVSVRVYDNASNLRTVSDAFYVKKDTSAPVITDNQSGDDAWRNAAGILYNVDLSDLGGSLLKQLEVKITTGAGQSGTLVLDWIPLLTGIDAASYTSDWGLGASTFTLLASGTNYVSVRVFDNAGSSATLTDAFYVRKDTQAPSITDGQAGENVWRNSNSGTYNVSFTDAGGSLLSKFQVRASTVPGGAGPFSPDWTDNVTAINAASYAGGWALTSGSWNLLQPGTNYLSIRALDNAGSPTDLADAFNILKDTQAPSGTAVPPANAGTLNFNVAYSTSDAGPAGVDYVKLYYTINTASPYTWTQFGGTFAAGPIAFTAPSGGTAGFRIVAYDKAGNSDEAAPPAAETAPEASTLIDLAAPVVTDNQSGDDAWRAAGGTAYNVDFSATGASNLDTAQYKVTAGPGQSGELLKDWTTIASAIGAASYTADWTVDFVALKSSFNYVSARVWTVAGNTTTLNDVFYVKKDTSPPAALDNQAGDNTWRKAAGTLYNVDFQDPLSLLANVQYSASSAQGSASGNLVPWTNIAYGISAENYTADWAVNFATLNSGTTNYISVRAYDLAGNVSISTDIFHVLKDTVPAVITDGQAGDAVWRASNAGVYNVDFADEGGSLLSAIQLRASTGPAQTGTLVFDWSDLATGINAASYTNNWALPAGLWDLLGPGTNYISARVWDNAGTTVTLNDVFYVLKDQAGPGITDNQGGDDAWRSGAGAVYNVDFDDPLSGLSSLQAKVHSEPGQAGLLLADWTQVSALSGAAYGANWPLTSGLFNAMAEAQNYVTIRVYDTAGNLSTLADAFYVKKDVTAPVITDNQVGDAVWRSTFSGITYNVDFSDSLSLVSKFQLRASSGPGFTGNQAFDWTDNTININAASYTDDWQLAAGNWSLLLPGTNYISIRAYDVAGATGTLADAFYVLKDTVAPAAIANLSAGTGSEGEVTLSWTAVGDDGSSGTAASYLVKVSSTGAINAGNFDAAQTYVQTWQPAAAGLTENGSLTGLQANALYYVAIKAVDKAGNAGAISNIPTGTTGADVTAPGTITLSAATGAFEGQVDLSWTAPGDNGVAIGTATAYLVRYRTDQAITSLPLWDSAQVYAQSWAPLGAGEAEVKTISGLNPGTVYYWAVRAVDEVNNTGALSNSPSAAAQTAGAVGGIMQFGVSSSYDVPYVRKWAPPDFGSAQTGVETAAAANSQIRHAVVKASKLRNEKLSGLLSSDGVLQVQRYNGVTDIWTNEWSVTDIGAANSAYRGFDIAYEQLSGRAMVLYSGATAGELKYNIWNGSSWSGAVTLTSGTANASLWVRLEPKPGSDELMAAVLKATSLEIYAMRWTSTTWKDDTQIVASAVSSAKQNYDLAWEKDLGRCIVVYRGATAGRAETKIWDGSAWSQYTANYFAFAGGNGNAQWIRLVPAPTSDRIGATAVDDGADWNASIWDSGWGYQATENTAVRNVANQARTIDAAWESDGNKLVVVAAETNNDVRYSSWTSGAWQTTLAAAPTLAGWSNDPNYIQLESDPNTNSIILNAVSAGNDFRAANWNGASFSLGATHTTAISANAYMPFDFALHRHDTSAPTVADNQAGDETWRNTNTGSYDVDANDTGGSGLKEIQVKVYTGAGQTGSLVMDWAAQVSTSGVNSYTLDWALAASTWTALREGVNYISVRSVDGALNTTVNPVIDAFYVKKDTTAPSVPSLSSPADNAAVNTQPVLDWSDSADATSGVAGYAVQVSTSDDFTTPVFSAAPAVSSATASGLASGRYFWRARAQDAAGNYSAYASTFAVFVDTAPPVITDLQAGDDAWRRSSGTVFNVDFSDAGGSKLQSVRYAVYSSTGRTGAELVSFSAGLIADSIGADSYTTDWKLSQGNWDLLPNGTNYVSAQAADAAGNITTLDDVFYIRKDVAAPSVTDNQAGDDAWRNSASALYNVDFADTGGSLIDRIQVKVSTGAAQTGTLISDWTDLAAGVNSASYAADWSLGASTFSLMQSGTNYVSVRVMDYAGSTTTLSDVFYVRKDTVAPSAPANVSPADGGYSNSAGPLFDWSDAADALSGISGYELYISTDQYFAVFQASAAPAASQHQAGGLASAAYYWRARAADSAGNYSAWSSTFAVVIDTAPPTVADNQAGDDNWRGSDPGAVYNVDFADAGGSLLNTVQYSAWTLPGFGGSNLVPWTNIAAPPVNQASYTADWAADFGLLGSGTSYISVRAADKAQGAVETQDVFYVRKDASAPSITDNQAGDETWRASNSGVYNVDYTDSGGSRLDRFQLKITTGPSQTGTLLLDWTDKAGGINSETYTADWALTFDQWTLLGPGTSYVSVRVFDGAQNSATLTDAFYVRKDTSTPSIADNQGGDDAWRGSNSGTYDIDFADAGGSGLAYFQVKVTSGPSQTGTLLSDWLTVVSGINAASYSANWALPEAVFTALQSGLNYVSVRAYDNAGLTTGLTDAFYVKKSTAAPQVTDGQAGDDTWRSAAGTLYDVDFADSGSSLLSAAQYKVTSLPAQAGTVLKDWTDIAANINASAYIANWSVDFSALSENGTNYVSVRAWDVAGATTTVSDVFYIRKDITLPGITDLQGGDDTWRNSDSGSYNVDFTDAGGSLLDKFQLKVTTGPSQTGTLVADWADAVTGMNAASYSTNWSLPAGLWNAMREGPNYVSVRVYDKAGNSSALTDAFYVRKDTTVPSVPALTSPADLAYARTLSPALDWTDASDGTSGVSGYEALVSTHSGFSVIASSGAPSASQFTAALSLSSTYYWKVRSKDNAGNYSGDASPYSLVVDTIAPAMTDGQAGELSWRKADGGAVYNVDFADTLSTLDTLQYSAWTGAGQTGANPVAWTNIAAGYGQQQYQSDWAVNFSLLAAGTNYISARAWDLAGSTATLADAFTVLKDTFAPSVTDGQAGDGTWRNSNSGTYNVDFADALSGLATAQYLLASQTGGGGTVHKDWTDIFSGLNAPSYTADWGLSAAAWGLLPEGTSYVTVRVFDTLAQNATSYDVFYVRKDTTTPAVTDNQADIALAGSQADVSNIDVDLSDAGGSLLSYAQYTAWSDGYLAGGEVIPWTNIVTGINAASYTQNWSVNFAALPNLAYSYITVRAYDNAGNVKTQNVFSLYKNASAPSITDNQPGDDSWRASNTGTYNVDFQSQSGQNLDKFQVRASTCTSGCAYAPDWTDVVTTIGAAAYTADWQLPASVFSAMQAGRNYASVRIFDLVPSSGTFDNIFYVQKDTSAPSITDGQAGDAAWRAAAGTLYNVDFADSLSGLATAQYRVMSGAGQTGTLLKDWTDIAALTPGQASYNTDWALDFAALAEVYTNYVSVRAYDVLGQAAALDDAFTVLKDTTPPTVPSSVSPADNALYSTSTVAFDWSDSSDPRSGLAGYTLQVSSYADFQTVAYSSAPAVSSAALYNTADGVYYWRARAADNAANYSAWTATRAFIVDVSSPEVINNQASPTQWYVSDPGTVFDVDFRDLSSGLTSVEYRITSLPAGGGTLYKDWTVISYTPGGLALYSAAWGVDFAAARDGSNYVSVRAFDRVALSSAAADAFVIRKDTSAPSITDNQAGDGNWRNAGGTLYNADFADAGVGVSTAQYRITSLPGGAGTVLKNWTDIFTGQSYAAYTSDWGVDFFSLAETATNYVSVRAWDALGSSRTLEDVFYILKDVTNPSIADNQADTAWLAADPGAAFDVDFADLGGAKLSKFQTKVTTGPAQTGTEVWDWTDRITAINATYYNLPWPLDFAAMPEGLNYVSVRVYDNAANPAAQTDVFAVRKDTTPPSVTDNQAGDDTWRSANNGAYNVDFADTGGSLLAKFQVTASSAAGLAGTPHFGWTDLVTGINAASYTADWALTAELWALLPSGTSYLSVRAWDNAGSSGTLADAFYIRKDTQTVTITDNQSGDTVWRSVNDGAYNVDASASGASLVDRLEVRSSTMPGNTGPFTSDWTAAVTGINSVSYTTNWALPGAVFDAMLSDATNYISVRAYNQAQNSAALADAFYVRKDTVPAAVTNNIAGGDQTWRNAAGTTYDLDFSDAGGSLLDKFQVKITTGASQTGTLVADWTDNVTGINAASYGTDWQLYSGAWDLLKEGTNYVSLRAYDIAGNITSATDAFRVFKDTTPAAITDNQAGDDVWRNANNGLYNLDFADTGGSRLSKFQVRASSNSGVVGPFSPDWTDNVAGINLASYTADWALASGTWDLLREGTNYISVRVYDYAGNLSTYGSQPFYVLKDTTSPSFVNGAAGGDLNWRNSSGTLHNVDAQDTGGSRLSVYQFSVTTGAARTGLMPVDWTNIASGIGSDAYAADWALPQAAWDLLPQGTNYVSVRAWDYAGSTGTLVDAFRIFKDTTPPSASSAQAGEFDWRGLNTGLYDADFTDAGGALLAKFQVRASTTPGAGPYSPDWTDNTLGLNAASYAADWALAAAVWDGLYDSATSYISLRAFDNAGSSFTLTDAFRVLKDTTPAVITDNQAGDDNWRSAAGTLYNADFSDYGSRVSSAAYAAWTQAAKGGAQSLAWTQIFTSTGLLSYTTDWGVDFNNAAQGFNYVAVRAWDKAGNLTELVDAFYLKKDTAAPTITDLQSGDTTWYRINPGNVFNVDFADGGIGLSSAAYEAWTGPGRTGTNVVASSQIFSGAPVSAYNAAWGLTDNAFALLAAGTNYISVTAWDALIHSSAAVDLFYILKDTVPPSGVTTLSAATPAAAADEGRLNVYWNAVGDNALTGSASYYLIRYHTDAISDGNFDSVSVFVSTLVPKAAGSGEGVIITGLTPSVTYYAAVKAVDKAGNTGALSNMTSTYAGLDLTAPENITDLSSLQGDFQGQVNLYWTAPGEGVAGVADAGTAQAYIVRYATFAVNAGNFSAPNVSSFTQTWTPLANGAAEARVLDGLTPGTSYSIAIKAVDEAGNAGSISNVIVGTAAPAGAAEGMLVYGDGTANMK